MVYRATRKRTPITRYFLFAFIFIGFLMLAFGVAVGIDVILNQNNTEISESPDESALEFLDPTLKASSIESSPAEEPATILPPRVDFQPIVDSWVTSVGGHRSVIIYDLDRDEITGSYNPDETYNTASLYKLFVVYEGYRRLERGEWSEDAAAGATGRTILKCLDLAIRESNSPCAETLWHYIGADALDEIIASDFGIINSDISRLSSNPTDILKIMQLFYHHPDLVNETYLAYIKDSFLNQPVTTYNWRQGLPSGFKTASVYNKVGWDYNPDGGYWNIYHDAAIIKFPLANGEIRHFIVVVMTNFVPFQSIRSLGSTIEETFYSANN